MQYITTPVKNQENSHPSSSARQPRTPALIESVLKEGESLFTFIEHSATHQAGWRKEDDAFYARAARSSELVKASKMCTYSLDEVMKGYKTSQLKRSAPKARSNKPAERAVETLISTFQVLTLHPHTCRRIQSMDLSSVALRELMIKLSNTGYLAVLEIADDEIALVLAVRHQHEGDYH